MKYLLSFVVCIGFFAGCTTPESNKNSDIETIVINNKSIKSVQKLDEVIDTISFLFLETSPNSIISNSVTKIEIKQNRVFVMKTGLDGNIAIFDANSGRFISKIIPTGSGPGEFSHIGKVNINMASKRLEAFSSFERKLSEYDFDGSFIAEHPFAIPFSTKVSVDTGLQVYATQVPTSITLETAGDFELFSLDSKNAFQKGMKRLNGRGQVQLVSVYSFFPYLDSIRYLAPFSDTIFHIANDHIAPRYVFKFTSGVPKNNFWQTIPAESILDDVYRKYKIPVTSPYFTESKNFFFGAFTSNDGYSYHYIYDKKNQKTKAVFSRLWYDKWDIPLPPILHVFEHGLLFLITPNECKQLVEEHPKPSLLPKEFLAKVKQLAPSDNPVLMIIKLK